MKLPSNDRYFFGNQNKPESHSPLQKKAINNDGFFTVKSLNLISKLCELYFLGWRLHA